MSDVEPPAVLVGPRSEPPPLPWRWFFAACYGGVAVIALILYLGGSRWGAIKPTADLRLHRGTGVGTVADAGVFTAPESWELRWEHSGELLEIRWTETTGTFSQCFAAMPNKPIRHHGAINLGRPGTYRLSVVGKGPWTVDVYSLTGKVSARSSQPSGSGSSSIE